MVVDTCFPPFVENWPDAELTYEGLSGRIMKSPIGWTMFMAADSDDAVPEHRHGAQWGVVLAGSMDLTIAGETQTYRAGDTHYIPAGVAHEAVLYAGWRGLYIFSREGLAEPSESRHAGVHHR